MKRVKSGVEGLDSLIGGGIPENFVVLASGTPGSGKTIMALQFLAEGLMNKEPGIFITFEQSKENIIEQAKEFGWDLEKYEKDNLLHIVSMWPHNFDNVLTKIKELNKNGLKRLVIDSITNVVLNGDADRELVHSVITALKQLNVTVFVTSELLDGQKGLSRDGISEFVADGVIILTLQEALDTRKLKIRKMRGTVHTLKPQQMQITDKGIKIGKD